jgi:hypothetical protein
MRPTKINKRRGSREAECISTKACFEAAIQSEVKATERKRKPKRTIKRKKRRELYDSDVVDPVMLYAGVFGSGEDSCQDDRGYGCA